MGMSVKISRWRDGYVLARLEERESGCGSAERFLNLCRARGIDLWDIRPSETGLEVCMAAGGVRACREPLRKAGVRLRILKKRGLPFALRRGRKKKGFLAGLAACGLILWGLSLFIWDIEIEGERMYSQDTLIRYLDSRDVRCGVPKSRLDADSLEEWLRSDFPEITWVSAQISGTRLLIKIKENEGLLSVPELEKEPRNIVAEKDGIVTDIVVRSGRAQVKAGEEVKAGQVLISGVLPVTDDSGQVVKVNLTAADGEVKARTVQTYGEDFEYLRREEPLTGKVRRGIFLRVGGFAARLQMPGREGTLWKTALEERQLQLTGNFFLPVWWGTICSREYVPYERPWTEEEEEAAKEGVIRKFTENLVEKGVQIEENNARIVENDSGFRVEGRAVLLEPIGVGRPIPEEEIPALEENDRAE